MTTRNQIILAAGIVVAATSLVAFQLRSGETAASDEGAGGHDHAAMAASDVKKPVVLDSEGERVIGVTFATVERRELPITVRTVGTVAYDETRLATVNPKIDGWVEHLYVDFTGAPVRAGEPLMDIYSPALVSAQEELVLAARLAREASADRARANAEELLASARRRLAYWDVPESEIRRIEESGEPTKTVTLFAPASGVVVEKNVVEGDRIMPGMTVYRIADLSRVWVEADVFEKDLALVDEGQGAEVTFAAYPGEDFAGRVTYVYPTVSMQSRTARIRLELPNPGQRLKPGMYAQIGLDIPPSGSTLVVPRSAVLATGERALVFVRSDAGAFLAREVVAGRTAGRFMELLDGIEEGERVVASAAFLVDAESNLGTMMGEDGSADGMEGMDHSGMDMPPDTSGAMDHSGTDHSGMDMPPDTSGAVDHSSHR